VSRGVGTKEEVLMEVPEVWSGGSGGTSGGECSQTLAEQAIKMGGVEVRVGEGEGAGGEEGSEVVVGNNAT
jgi:hypothetical protein